MWHPREQRVPPPTLPSIGAEAHRRPGANHWRPPRHGRVLHVLEATIGGTKRHLHDLAAGLRRAGWDVEAACPRVRAEALGDTSFWDDLLALGIPLHEVPMRRTPIHATNVAAVTQLAQLMRQRRFAIVHAHSSIAGALARPAALLSGTRPKLVYTPHGFAFLGNGRNGGERGAHTLFLRIEQALGRVTDRLIAVSPTEAEEAVRYGVTSRERVRVITNGVIAAGAAMDREAARADVRRSQGWDHAPVIGTIARMTAQKDPLTWLHTAARIAGQRPDARFVWIWTGEMEPEVRAEAQRLGLADRVDFLGYRADARRLLAGMDVFLLTSKFEGLPYSAIEALASGTPVVATDVVGTRDVIVPHVTGLLAPPGDPAALADQVLHLLEHSDQAQRLATAGREDVLRRFSIEEMVARTAAVYDELI